MARKRGSGYTYADTRVSPHVQYVERPSWVGTLFSHAHGMLEQLTQLEALCFGGMSAERGV
jgi:hypothetical protein